MQIVAWIFCAATVAAGLAFPAALAFAGGQFLSLPRIVLFGGLPVCAALAAFVAILKGKAARQLCLAYGLALVAAFYGAEFYLSVRAALTPGPAAAAKIDLPAGVRAYPQLCGADLQLRDPPFRLGGHPVQPLTGLSGNLLNPADDRADWRFTDQYGFNNPPGQWTNGAVMVVGDSYTFGADVPIGRGFVDRLRERLGPVVNLGCDGNGPLMELAGLAEYGPLLRPRVVVWAYFEGNDLHPDLGEELRSPILPQYFAPGFSQQLAANRDELDRTIAGYLDRRLREANARQPTALSVSDIVSKRNVTLGNLRYSLGLAYQLDPQLVGVFERVLRRANAIVSAWGGRLVFLYLPDRGRYTTTFGKLDAEPYGRQVIALAQSLGLEVLDIDAEFRKRADPAALNGSRHYTVEGYALVGDAIADRLARGARPER
jgi:hypothetical protein